MTYITLTYFLVGDFPSNIIPVREELMECSFINRLFAQLWIVEWMMAFALPCFMFLVCGEGIGFWWLHGILFFFSLENLLIAHSSLDECCVPFANADFGIRQCDFTDEGHTFLIDSLWKFSSNVIYWETSNHNADKNTGFPEFESSFISNFESVPNCQRSIRSSVSVSNFQFGVCRDTRNPQKKKN